MNEEDDMKEDDAKIWLCGLLTAIALCLISFLAVKILVFILKSIV